jgi:hypothetical protein
MAHYHRNWQIRVQDFNRPLPHGSTSQSGFRGQWESVHDTHKNRNSPYLNNPDLPYWDRFGLVPQGISVDADKIARRSTGHSGQSTVRQVNDPGGLALTFRQEHERLAEYARYLEMISEFRPPLH